jgi:hypothetical protein
MMVAGMTLQSKKTNEVFEFLLHAAEKKENTPTALLPMVLVSRLHG